MTPFDSLKHGMGIGGWITNYKRGCFLIPGREMEITIGDREHFERYITRWDFQNIRSFGMDHIRIPFDHHVIEYPDKPFTYREDLIRYVDQAIEWAYAEGLTPIINLHTAFGNASWDGATDLFQNELKQERFIALWEMFEDRYHHDNNIVFEILNEVTNNNWQGWNSLNSRAIAAIRKKNPVRRIVIGAVEWANPPYLPNLNVFEDDEYVGYTYHFYESHTFTHQRVMTMKTQYMSNREVPYPSDNSWYKDYSIFCGGDGKEWDKYPVIDKRFLLDRLQPVLNWKKEHPNKWLWMGEFGSFRQIKIDYRLNWMRDVIGIAVENGIPFSSWNYLSTPYDTNKFSLVNDDTRRLLHPKLGDLIMGIVD